MEIVDFLQLFLLLGLLVAVAILLFSFRAFRHSHDQHDDVETTNVNRPRLGPRPRRQPPAQRPDSATCQAPGKWMKKGRPTWGRPLG